MPIFECHRCRRQFLVPLAQCDGMLKSLTVSHFDAENQPIYSGLCDDCIPLKIEVVGGDLVDQNVDVIVNPWNCNWIPWWPLRPDVVSRAIKRHAGIEPFQELYRHGPIPAGGAVLTSAGKLPYSGIIHVAVTNMLMMATEWSIRESTRNAVVLAHEKGFQSMAFLRVKNSVGHSHPQRALEIMLDQLGKLDIPMTVKLVAF